MSSRKSEFLIGYVSEKITGHQLPSNCDVLSVVFYQTLNFNVSVHQAANTAYNEVASLWHRARIPIRAKHHCIAKIKRLHDELRIIQRNRLRRDEKQEALENEFSESLNDLFDIASADALERITIQEDKDFLTKQRKKGRPGYMAGVDIALAEREQRSAERHLKDEERREKYHASTSSAMSSVSSETIGCEGSDEDICEPAVEEFCPPARVASKRARPKADFMTDKLAAALDRAKVSNPMATLILTAMMESFDLNVEEYAVNVSSIRNSRDRLREERADKIKSSFTENLSDYHTVHFDGKKLKDPKTGKFVKLLPVLLTGLGCFQLLGSPEIPSETGEDCALKVFELLMKWGVVDVIQAACADITNSNTGWENGAIVILEELLGRKLLYLACQHHVDEVVLKGVFEEFVSPSSAPENPLFARFKESWDSINKANFTPGIADPVILQELQGKENEIIQYAVKQLEEHHSRADYRELLELTVIFLGGTPPDGITFHQPGAVSEARFMGKAIYSLKIAMFHNQFSLSKRQLTEIQKVCVFIVRFYVKLWFVAPVASAAPYSVFVFLRDVAAFSDINPKLVEVVFKKMSCHLWYFGQESVSLAFFDSNVPADVKEKMRTALQKQPWEEPKKRFVASPGELKMCIVSNDLDVFVSKRSLSFFERFSISTDFLMVDAALWESQEFYQKDLAIVSTIQVTNDVAERAVELTQDYRNILTVSESQRDNIMLVISEHRRVFPDFKKSTLSKDF